MIVDLAVRRSSILVEMPEPSMSCENRDESTACDIDHSVVDRAEICRELAEIGAQLDAISELQITGRHRVVAILELHRRRAVLVYRLEASSRQA
jgi:hypothetical protein